VAYPCYSRILAEDYPQESRGLANALLDAGSKLGPALGTFLGGVLLARTGWRIFFVALGAASLLWLLPWLKWMPRGEGTQRAAAGGPTLTRILKTPTAWGAFLAHFCGNYFWFFLLTWLPSYLVKERGYSIEGMATVGSAAYLAIAAATVCAGWLSDRLIRGGADATRVRRTIVCGGLAGSTVILPVAIVESQAAAIALLLVSCAAFGVYTSNHWAITQTLAGPRAAGRWTSLQNGVGNLSGIVAAWLTGALVQSTGRFWLAFVTAAGVALAGAALWRVTVRELKEVGWEEGAS
jgi:predicted MFS family arabinose efflux permease